MPRLASLQQLPPRWARLCLEVDAQLLRLAPDVAGASLVIACSGGIDSTALLHILAYLQPKNGYTLHCAHVDHGLRPGSADDRSFVEHLCAELAIPFHGIRIDVRQLADASGVGIEEAGRSARYEFFESVRQKTHSDHILVAHHQGDLMEDVLLRLLRGAGWPGLSGMYEADSTRHLLRPLLHVPKEELREFLIQNALTWREDESNDDREYTRNRIRHDILPLILKENAGFGNVASRLHAQGALDGQFFDQAVAAIPISSNGDEIVLRANDLAAVHPAIRLRLYKKILDSLGPGQVLAETLLKLDRAVADMPLPRTLVFQFPGEKLVRLNGDNLLFGPRGGKD